ncbi:hypothetical protein H2201_008921 [Coniosporium apollinis]|uniref:Uncharacterized protein n=1 Tax=Coniosporium apollinis TaxID=61459 RepID=A0ABQ9NFR9_9PEZI|nr:hypothetical protein H2201_008921 [Coniosporium apollinis]
MKLSLLPTLLAISATASAWEVGLWGPGGYFQRSGNTTNRCTTTPPIRIGQVTFDSRTDNAPDPTRIIVYANANCLSDILYQGCPSRIRRPAQTPGVARAFRVL